MNMYALEETEIVTIRMALADFKASMKDAIAFSQKHAPSEDVSPFLAELAAAESALAKLYA